MSKSIVIEEYKNNDLVGSMNLVAYGPFDNVEDASEFMRAAKRAWPLRRWSYVELHNPYWSEESEQLFKNINSESKPSMRGPF